MGKLPPCVPWRIGEVLLLSLLPIAVLLLLLPFLIIGITPAQSFLIIGTMLAQLTLLLFSLSFIRKRNIRLSEVGLTRLNLKALLVGASAALLLAVPPRLLLGGPTESLAWSRVLVHAIVTPVSEEIYFRGIAYLAFRCKCGVYKGIIASAVFFAVSHFYYFIWKPLGLLTLLLLGLTLTTVYEWTGSLPSAMVAHSLYNLTWLIPLKL